MGVLLFYAEMPQFAIEPRDLHRAHCPYLSLNLFKVRPITSFEA